jgi:class 3 adenylate cyclase
MAQRAQRRARGRLLNRVSIQSKLILMLVACTVLASAIVGAIAYKTGRDALRAAAFNRLTEIRESQKRTLEDEVSNLRNALVTYTYGQTTQNALRDFTAGFDQLANVRITPEQSGQLVDFYTNTFAKDTEKYSGVRLAVAALLPTSNAERCLQATYTTKLPSNDVAVATPDARDGSAWSAASAKYHSYFREIVTRFAFEDALLIDPRGNVVYSFYKDVDLGTNILTGPYNSSKLRDAFTEALSSNKQDRVVITDFEFYQPATMAATAWMVAPIPPGGKSDGVIALQFPITKINRLMTFDKKWSESGLGQTGETILAGPDFLMRSDSRLFLEDPERYRKEVIAAGTPPDIPDIAIRQGGTTLIQPVSPNAHKLAQEGQSGTVIARDYLGRQTLQSYAPVRSGNSAISWSIVAKLTTSEAFAPEAVFTRIVVLATTAIILAACLLAAILARVFVRPLRRLEAGVQRISAGDYDVEIPVQTRDEIGELTGMFNEMSRSLTVKEDLVNEHQRQIRRLLRSIMPAPLAEKFQQGEEITAREHANVSVIFVDIGGLDRVQAELDSGESLAILNELLRQFDAAAEDYDIDRVRAVRNGYLGSCGLTVPRLDNVRRAVDFAQECHRIVERFNAETSLALSLRCGIDTGTVSSGLIGEPSMVFDLWGSAVNLAHRIQEGAPAPGIYLSARAHDKLGDATPAEPAGTVRTESGEEPIWKLAEPD